MLDKKILAELRTALENRRRELFNFRKELADSYQELSHPEIELEETAAKANLARGLEQLDDRETEQIQKIDNALVKMEEGRYGRCEACGKPIPIKRLRVVPEARHCIRCAKVRQTFDRYVVTEPPVSIEEQEYTDEEMQDAIEDALRRDGRVETQELEIRCEAGVANLGGFLPSKREHRILHEIIADDLGFTETVDNITIDRQPWERPDRDQPLSWEKEAEDIQMEGEDKEVDSYTSTQEGEPMTPPDRIFPEKE
jgi:DnaK suppressor protein